MKIIKRYINSYLDEKDEDSFFGCLHPNFHCKLIRDEKEVAITREEYKNILHRHFMSCEKANLVRMNALQKEGRVFKSRVISHQVHKGMKYEIDDYQTYKIDFESNLISYIKHDWTITKLD